MRGQVLRIYQGHETCMPEALEAIISASSRCFGCQSSPSELPKKQAPDLYLLPTTLDALHHRAALSRELPRLFQNRCLEAKTMLPAALLVDRTQATASSLSFTPG